MTKESQNYPNKNLKFGAEVPLIRSFGRIKSRKFSDHKNFLLQNLLPLYQFCPAQKNFDSKACPKTTPFAINLGFLLHFLFKFFRNGCVFLEKLKQKDLSQKVKLNRKEKNSSRDLFFGTRRVLAKKNFLEIGFGFGDFLFEKAKKNPDILFFASEPHLNGVVNLLAKLEKEPLKNLKISTQDVRNLLSNFPDKFFDEVFILFPDPWPKAKHFKRRLISLEFLDKILSVKMKTNGNLTIATDHDSYKTWILSVISRSENFSWRANSKKDWQNFPDDWVTTKYQKKALNEGRVPVIFNLNCHE